MTRGHQVPQAEQQAAPPSEPQGGPQAEQQDVPPQDPAAAAPAAGSRPRDAEARRAEILEAARRSFGRHAYADTTIGAIAQGAGVSPALVMKYFGSKEQLFAQVFTFDDEDARALLDAPLPDLARHMVLRVLSTQTEHGRDPILRIAFSRLHAEQGEAVRENFKARVVGRLAERLPGPDAGLRAEMAVGVLLGLGALYAMVQADELRALPPEQVAERYVPLLEPLLLEQPPTGRSRR
ncbi:TetR/AcrR family transcriptional regulator [Streptacidiphilus sp. EB129]|uniref:TetR/AcrR family transcriptional regulator n=1 Tax=Streptacidiphilus sp. EB129 TaxID=3156262 RepID=UPI0035183704